MKTPEFDVFLADLKTKTEPREYLECFLKGIAVTGIKCLSKEEITLELFSERIEKNIKFQIGELAEKEIHWDMLYHYYDDFGDLYKNLLKEYLENDEDSPQFKYEFVKEMESLLKARKLNYDSNSRRNFSSEVYFNIIPINSFSNGFHVGYNQLILSDNALHHLSDAFKIRYELIQSLLQITEGILVILDSEIQKTFSFQLDQTKGSMLITEFVVAITDEKKGLLNLNKAGKHALAKKLFELFGLTYKKWLEHDVLSRDNASYHLNELCDILTERKFPKKLRTK